MSTLRVDNLETTDSLANVAVADLALGMPGISNVAGVRALTTTPTSLHTLGYYAPGDGGAADYYLDATDTTTVDNGGSVLVTAGGARYKLATAAVNVLQFGARLGLATDSSLAYNNAVAYAKSRGLALHFPGGKYNLPTAAPVAGRVFLTADQDVTLVGNLVFSDSTFPVSADVVTPLTDTVPFFNFDGLNFQGLGNTWALSVRAQYGFSFIDCLGVANCRFYGKYGLQAKNIISANLENCWFYNGVTGLQPEGCVNWSVAKCKWRNQVGRGLNIVPNPDDPGRKGGENVRLSQCEFAVCATGIRAIRHAWLMISDCLFDYNCLPIELQGCPYAKIAGTYAGASQQGSLISNPDYITPPTIGTALYVRPWTDGVSIEPGSLTTMQNEWVNYLNGSSQPLVNVDGAVAGVGQYMERVVMVADKYLAQGTHTAAYLLNLSHLTDATLMGVEFQSYNSGPALVAPYAVNTVSQFEAVGSITMRCTVSSVERPATNEQIRAIAVRGSAAGGVYLQDPNGANKLGVSPGGNISLTNATVSAAANAGGGSLPASPSGFVTIDINGGLVKVPYYNT